MKKSILEKGNVDLKGFIKERDLDKENSLDDLKIRKLQNFPDLLKTNYPSDKNITERLKKAYTKGTLSIILGAGISLEHGLPTWNELILETMVYALSRDDIDNQSIRDFSKLYINCFLQDPLIAARHIEGLIKVKGINFFEFLKERLYDREVFNEKSPFYASIANLCASARTSKSISSIITFNFDNLLETYLDKLTIKIPYKVYGSNSSLKDKVTLPIYHVHGFLPKDNKKTISKDIIFDERSYHNTYHDAFHWSNIVQIDTYTKNICIFIGLSMNDPNLRRLLDASAKLHKRKKKDFHVVVLKLPNIEYLLKRYLENENHSPSQASVDFEYIRNLYSKSLNKLYQKAKRIEMQTLNCDILFVNDFNEIPNLLREIIT